MMKVICCLIIALVFLNNPLMGQRTGAGYFGNIHFVGIEVSPMPHLFTTGLLTADTRFQHQWSHLPKLSLELGHQKKIASQWRLGASYYQMPDVLLSSIAETSDGNGMATKTKTGYTAIGNNFQFFFCNRKYVKGIAPSGVYIGIKAGLSVSSYKHQLIDTISQMDYNHNTLNRTVKIEGVQKSILQTPFIGMNLGKTVLLGSNTTFDLGFRMSHFFGKGKITLENDLNSALAFKHTLYRMNLQALNSTQTFEIYAVFTLYY